MTIAGRILSKTQSLQSTRYERYAVDEESFRAALVDLATSTAPSKTLVVADNIYLSTPLTIGPELSGISFRAVSRQIGIQQSPLVAPFTAFATGLLTINGASNLEFRNMTIGSSTGVAANSGVYINKASNVTFVDCDIAGVTAPISLVANTAIGDVVQIIKVRGCKLTGSPVFTGGDTVSVSDCYITGLVSITTSAKSYIILGNHLLSGLVVISVLGGIIISSNIAFGSVDTSSGLNRCTVVGNYMNGFALTTAGGDSVGTNHA